MQSYRLDVQSPIVDIVGDGPDDSCITDIIPLVVNTMGWNKGLGADLTRQIEDMVEPTDIFEFEAPPFCQKWNLSTMFNSGIRKRDHMFWNLLQRLSL